MKLTILGCFGPYAPKDSACSSYLIQSDNLNIMIDCGHGAFSQLQKHINFRELNALIITHFHPDHYCDIHAVRHAFRGAMWDGSRQDPLVVYVPSEPKDIFEEICSWDDVFITIPIEEALLRDNTLGKVNVKFFRAKHPIPTYGVRIIKGDKSFSYTSDTAWDNSLIENCFNSDLLLVEASLREIDIDYTKKGHLTAKQAGLLGQKAQVRKLIITHFYPEYNVNQIKREAEVGFERAVEIAKTGKTYVID